MLWVHDAYKMIIVCSLPYSGGKYICPLDCRVRQSIWISARVKFCLWMCMHTCIMGLRVYVCIMCLHTCFSLCCAFGPLQCPRAVQLLCANSRFPSEMLKRKLDIVCGPLWLTLARMPEKEKAICLWLDSESSLLKHTSTPYHSKPM